jgi:hypothetical protein
MIMDMYDFRFSLVVVDRASSLYGNYGHGICIRINVGGLKFSIRLSMK